MVKKLTLLCLTSALCINLIAQNNEAKTTGLQSINQQELSGPLEFLSSDLLEGREAGTRGAFMAAYYLASQFKTLGLTTLYQKPAASLNDYLQKVQLISEEVTGASLSLTTEGSTISFEEEIDFSPLKVSHNLSAHGELFFGGYGLGEGPTNNFPENVRGKILVRAKGYPGATDSTSTGHRLFSKLSTSELDKKKNQAAREAGILAILEFDPSLGTPFEGSTAQPETYAEKELTKYSSGIYKRKMRLANSPIDTDLPVFTITHRVVSAIEPNWKTILETRDPEKKVKTKNPEKNLTANLSASIKSKLFHCNNVVGCIEGKKTDEIIVVGAHYDHLGFYNGYLWNGADDNGSGAVGMLALAKAFILSGIKPERTLLFAAWTGEERGLLGSSHFVETFDHPEQIKYYHNYDMIGRSPDPLQPDSNVGFIYTEAWEEAKTLSMKNNQTYALGLNLRFGPVKNPTGGSDNGSFARKEIPIMWFHTGGHPDYHQPSDHVEKIDWEKMEAIVKLSFLNLWDLAMDPPQ